MASYRRVGARVCPPSPQPSCSRCRVEGTRRSLPHLPTPSLPTPPPPRAAPGAPCSTPRTARGQAPAGSRDPGGDTGRSFLGVRPPVPACPCLSPPVPGPGWGGVRRRQEGRGPSLDPVHPTNPCRGCSGSLKTGSGVRGQRWALRLGGAWERGSACAASAPSPSGEAGGALRRSVSPAPGRGVRVRPGSRRLLGCG